MGKARDSGGAGRSMVCADWLEINYVCRVGGASVSRKIEMRFAADDE